MKNTIDWKKNSLLFISFIRAKFDLFLISQVEICRNYALLISDITLSLPTIPSLLSRCTTTSQDLQRVKKLGILRSLPDASCASLHLARWEFSRVPETLPDPIISCVRIRNDFAVARWRCGNAEPAQEQEARERERKGGGGREKLHPSHHQANQTSACCVALPHAPRYALTRRDATRKEAGTIGAASEIPRGVFTLQ